MTERNVGRPWSAEEDSLLKAAVDAHGENDNWKIIAQAVPGRSNKACRKRWLHSLSPTVKKSAWTQAEDQKLLDCYNSLGPRWSAIARQIPGRTDDACSKRYREALNPNLRKDEWTPEEDKQLVQAYAQIGGKWGQVGQELNRSGLACRNRWRLLERKKLAMSAKQRDHIPYSQAFASEPSWYQDPDFSVPVPSPVDAEASTPWDSVCYSQDPYSSMNAEPHNSLQCSLIHLTPMTISSFSSLSNALSDPPPPPRPLPNVTDNTLGIDSELLTPTTISPQPSIVGLMDSQMTLVDHSEYTPTPFMSESQLSPHPNDATQTLSYPDEVDNDGSHSSPDVYSHEPPQASALVQSSELSQQSPYSSEVELLRIALPMGPNDAFLPDGSPGNVSSPGGITPLGLPSQTPSPSLTAITELPSSSPISTTAPAGSLLFSTPSFQVTPPESSQPRKRKSPIQMRRIMEDAKPHRLSSRLRLTLDSSVLPYACGYDCCWPTDSSSSSSCFAMSKDLSEHVKIHENEESDRPFRCGLSGCGKSWKSINGLQYHLQISTAHFRQALSTRFSTSIASSSDVTDPEPAEGEDAGKSARKFICKHPGCFKAYRQLSGLRYHRKHGHPQDMPAQLEVVPPSIVAQLPEKTKKMRRKDPPAQSAK
uniref:MYB transcription factor 20 n=1 Tax=Pleurotus ostreatus TaxID=5322 RepID=A0A2Z5EN50_PLEOS|nr:MYB transcription factor 20 [Pleurotus ostreatus]